MYRKNLKGDCPYCGGPDLSTEPTQDDPRRIYKKCDGCSKYSVTNRVTQHQYPLVDPLDKASSPGVLTQ